jgi:hypothetical protein
LRAHAREVYGRGSGHAWPVRRSRRGEEGAAPGV